MVLLLLLLLFTQQGHSFSETNGWSVTEKKGIEIFSNVEMYNLHTIQ